MIPKIKKGLNALFCIVFVIHVRFDFLGIDERDAEKAAKLFVICSWNWARCGIEL